MSKPLLSIGIIFKNEIRCLERCLKSLRPLRDALPCELVMADTGADDGSRAVAERYADIVFDFPWINDFAAARNAVMNRCSGMWYMTIDCDEWVDPNIEGYVKFLTTDKAFDFASVIIRNYHTAELERSGGHSDFLAVRLLRLSSGIRYEGAIHEHWPYQGDLRTMLIRGGIFHHDGYVFQDPAKRVEKQKRNMELLCKQLEGDPDNLITLTQCVESSDTLPEQGDYLRRAMAGVEEKRSQWKLFGPPIYRCAVRYAIANQLPELEEWIKKAEAMFPDSIFVRVEIAWFAFGVAWNKDDYAKSIYWGEKYLQGVNDYEAGRFDQGDLLASSLNKTDSHSKLGVATVLASGYLHEKQPEKCLRLMESLDFKEMDGKQAGDCVRNLCNLHSHFDVNTAPLALRLWEGINSPCPTQAQADQRRAGFLQVGAGMFEGAFIRSEGTEEDVIRHAYTAFLPLEDRYELGIAAQMLETEDAAALEALLGKVEELEKLPGCVLAHALESGAEFPLAGRPLAIEDMDGLARRLAQEKGEIFGLAARAADRDLSAWQALTWARGLVIAAVRVFEWKKAEGENAERPEEEKEQGVRLARGFAKVEGAFIARYYRADTLSGEAIYVLPPMHRFGWYCAQAFEALDSGDAAGYVRLLRAGLELYGDVAEMVEFLLDCTPGLQAPQPPAELLALAEQIRTVLANFAPDDPAVAALKQSEAYQKVAYLIEGLEPPVVGGLPQ